MSKKVEYALIGLLHMSRKKGQTLTTARELACSYHIPQELMGKVLQQLKRRNLIQSVQGVKGGYRINQPVDKITLSLICEVIDGPFKIVSCFRKAKRMDCEQHHFCIIKNPMEIIQNKLEVFFKQQTLKDLEQEVFKSYSPRKKVEYSGLRKSAEV